MLLDAREARAHRSLVWVSAFADRAQVFSAVVVRREVRVGRFLEIAHVLTGADDRLIIDVAPIQKVVLREGLDVAGSTQLPDRDRVTLFGLPQLALTVVVLADEREVAVLVEI